MVIIPSVCAHAHCNNTHTYLTKSFTIAHSLERQLIHVGLYIEETWSRLAHESLPWHIWLEIQIDSWNLPCAWSWKIKWPRLCELCFLSHGSVEQERNTTQICRYVREEAEEACLLIPIPSSSLFHFVRWDRTSVGCPGWFQTSQRPKNPPASASQRYGNNLSSQHLPWCAVSFSCL